MKRRAAVAVAVLVGLLCAAFAAVTLGSVSLLFVLDLIGPMYR